MVEGGSGVFTPGYTAAPWMRLESVAGGPISRKDSMEAPIVSSTKLPWAAREKEDSETLVPYSVSPRWPRHLEFSLPLDTLSPPDGALPLQTRISTDSEPCQFLDQKGPSTGDRMLYGNTSEGVKWGPGDRQFYQATSP